MYRLIQPGGRHATSAARAGISFLVCCGILGLARAATITLRDGRTLSGRVNSIAGVAEDPLRPRIDAGGVDVTPILIVEDGLRRTYVPRRHTTNVEAADIPQVTIRVDQNVAEVGARIASVGPLLRVTPFDKFGRRIYAMSTQKGAEEVVQGITEITPTYTRVQGLSGPRRPIVWDMRIATSSIPRETLTAILRQAVPQEDPQARLAVVRLYLQMELYRRARLELEQIVKEMPQLEGLDAEIRELRQMGARRVLAEIELRNEAGQHQFVQNQLANFPAEEVAGETLQQVREMLAEYDARQRKLDLAKQLLAAAVTALRDDAIREEAAAIAKEIADELNFNSLARMAPLLQLGTDGSLPADEKAALAISGWLLGGNNASENLPVALSLVEVRDLVHEFLREPTQPRRAQLLEAIREKEGASIDTVAKMLRLLTPPLDLPELVDQRIYGLFQHQVPGLNDHPDIRYLVQVPPEYDPHRRYPVVVTLNGAGSTPELQLDYWAGPIIWQGESEARIGGRIGQAMRHGYITVAIDWRKPHQYQYEFSAREHHAVLSVIRDVSRRFSVDVDRLFLSGHDIGGDAAWDLALAHPDVWAGAVPIVAVANRYCTHYWQNAKYVPLYFVAGEFDGSKMKKNARSLDRYLRTRFDTTVAEYLGRGHEPFSDEIQRLFVWMDRRKRDFFPKEFECVTMRRWDNYFWWIEVDGMPERTMVEPTEDLPRNPRPLKIHMNVTATNGIRIQSGSKRTTIWLAPELVDFGRRIRINVDGHRVDSRNTSFRPDLAILLEDARARADYQHPFWAKVEVP